MRFIDFTTMGFKNLWRRKLRTVLTMVGVSIGTFSIVIMMSLGIALRESYTKQLEEWGSLTVITISRYNYVDTGDSGVEKKNNLDDKLVSDVRKIEHVRAVAPILELSGRVKSGKYLSYIDITGIDPDIYEYFEYPKVVVGNKLTNDEPNGILLGYNSVFFRDPKSKKYEFGTVFESPVDVMKDKITITFDDIYNEKAKPKYEKANIVGVMEESNNGMGYGALAPLEQVKKWYKEKQNSKKTKQKDIYYSSILVSVEDTQYVKEVQDKIKELGYSSSSRADELSHVNDMSNTIQMVLGGIGAVSLLVSAIGIANTMIMSIYERTKEIGVMKVLGCVISDIRKLFLFEAGIIGLLGGFLGLGLSYGISALLNNYAPEIGEQIGVTSGDSISMIPVWLAVSAVLFSIFIGMVSGLYPAMKATKIKAIEAMRSSG